MHTGHPRESQAPDGERGQTSRYGTPATWLTALCLLGAAQLAAWTLGAQAQAPPGGPGRNERVVEDFAAVRAGPGDGFDLVWRLYEGSQVVALDDQQDGDGKRWRRIRLWNAGDGWLAASALTAEPFPPPATPTPRPTPTPGPPAPPVARPPHVPESLRARGSATTASTLTGTPDDDAAVGGLTAGAAVAVDAWTVGADGRVRYHVTTECGAGWAAPGAVALQSADPVARALSVPALLDPLRGIGMWFILDSREHGVAAASRVAAAARANGFTHLYVEVATSSGGFWGRGWLDELLPAAGREGVRIVGSVFAELGDVPRDVALAREVAAYRTPSGLALDGLTADLEHNLVAENIQAFGELLRHYLGDDYLLVATVYPPESYAAPRYPWPALAASWNAVAPMAYWRQMENRPLAPDGAYAYVQRNVEQVRTLTGRPDVPIDVLGQLFEMDRPRLLGPDGPTAGEIEAAIAAARDTGAVGISFFDWTRATPAHWETLARLQLR